MQKQSFTFEEWNELKSTFILRRKKYKLSKELIRFSWKIKESTFTLAYTTNCMLN